MTPIAFFDFDGTITRHDTFISFARYARGTVRFMIGLSLASPWLALWKLGLASNARAKEKLFGILFKGMNVGVFRSYAEAFATKVDNDLRTGTLKTLEKHRKQGHRIAIVSASINTWIEPWARQHGIDCVVSTEAEVGADGRLTGHFATPNCNGVEKVRRIKAMFGNLENVDTYAYGDSKGDDAMLKFAKHSEMIS